MRNNEDINRDINVNDSDLLNISDSDCEKFLEEIKWTDLELIIDYYFPKSSDNIIKFFLWICNNNHELLKEKLIWISNTLPNIAIKYRTSFALWLLKITNNPEL